MGWDGSASASSPAWAAGVSPAQPPGAVCSWSSGSPALAPGLPHAHGAEQSCPYPHLCHVPWIRNSWNRCTGLWPNSQGGIPKFSDSRPEHIHSCQAVGTGDTPEHPSPEAQLISRMCVKQDLIISPPCPHFPASSKQRGVSSSAVQSVSLAQASRAGQGSLLPSA